MVNQPTPRRRLQVGDAVSVPFGRRWLNGTVIERTKSIGTDPKVVVSVHIAGGPADEEMLSTYREEILRTPDGDQD
ncbi:hypothetical protein [Curtobacterium sp. MCBA15_009]|uniref:hypothetical protein n=1 Tax=Curtobacterium sp. MCBA15_009 TaxID=1898737 RepID=UPI0011137367|nr:hypothetical protein [Curtobacterium sp. MCBA15_009]